MALPSGGGKDRARPWLAVKGEKAWEQGAPQTLVPPLSGCETSATLCSRAVLSHLEPLGCPSHLRAPTPAVPQFIHCKHGAYGQIAMEEPGGRPATAPADTCVLRSGQELTKQRGQGLGQTSPRVGPEGGRHVSCNLF